MKKDLNEALTNVEMTYKDVVEVSNEILDEIMTPINKLIDEITENASSMPVENLRDYMLRLQLRAYELSETKEKSAFKAECAEALRKEKYARSFNEASGTSGAKDNTATIESSEEIIVEALYNLVASLLKTKLDEIHRLTDVLKSILVSRMQEAKLSMNGLE